jgi:hypothetical protein
LGEEGDFVWDPFHVQAQRHPRRPRAVGNPCAPVAIIIDADLERRVLLFRVSFETVESSARDNPPRVLRHPPRRQFDANDRIHFGQQDIDA